MNSWLNTVTQWPHVKISSNLIWAVPRPFYSPVNHTFGQANISQEKKKKERNQCFLWGSFSTCQAQNQWCHLSAWSEAGAEQGPEISPGARQHQQHKFQVLPPPSCASETTLGATSCGFWAQAPCSALKIDLRPWQIPWKTTFPGSRTATAEVFGVGRTSWALQSPSEREVKDRGKR